MLARGLLYRIADPMAQGRPIELRASILAHLREVLNIRSGESPAAPDLGVPDFSDLAHAFPDAVASLQRAVKATIERYEPRLRNVSVRLVPGTEMLRLTFEITAYPSEGRGAGALRFSTTLVPGGLVDVR